MSKLNHCSSTVNSSHHSSIVISDVVSSRKAQTRISCAHRIANCLDTLKISFWLDLSESKLLEDLEDAKYQAQSDDVDSEPIVLDCIDWNCMRNGTRMYTFRLVRGDVKIIFNKRKHTGVVPNARLEIGSISCWVPDFNSAKGEPGYESVYKMFVRMIESYGGKIERECVSEIHMAADFIGDDIVNIPVDRQDHWINRAEDSALYFKHKCLTGSTIGKGDLMLRIYNKSKELKNSKSKAETFRHIWETYKEEDISVTRVEFQVRRPILRDFSKAPNNDVDSLSTLQEVTSSLNSLWKYCSSEWCRLASAPVDRNNHQTRSETHPWWKKVQSVEWTGKDHLYRYQRHSYKDIDRIKSHGVGSFLTIAASMGCDADDLQGIGIIAKESLASGLSILYQKDPAEFKRRMRRKINETLSPFSKPSGPLDLSN